MNVCFAIYLSYIRVYGTLDPSMLGYMMISIYAAALGIVLSLVYFGVRTGFWRTL